MMTLEASSQDTEPSPRNTTAGDHAVLRDKTRAVACDLPMVLHVRVVTGHGGGPEKTILNSPRFLPTLGYQSKLAYLHPPGDPGIDVLIRRGAALGATVLSVPDQGPLDFGVIRRLVRICRQEKVAIWHGHDYKSNFLGLIVRCFWPMQLVTTLHGWTNLSGRVPIYVKVDKWSLKFYKAAICVSEDLVEECHKLRLASDRCHLIHNAIDIHEYRRTLSVPEAKRQLGCEGDDFLIGAVGRLSPEKAFDQLIRAVVELRQAGRKVALWIAGDGSAQGELQSFVHQLDAGSYVRLLGHVSDPKLFYQAMDVFALSSIREGLPNVVLEAMALETPVVATRIAGLPTLIESGRDGLLIEPSNLPELKGSLARLVDDGSLRQQLATAARATIEARFSFSRRMEKMASVYDQLLGDARAV